jgi:hypothetical protein
MNSTVKGHHDSSQGSITGSAHMSCSPHSPCVLTHPLIVMLSAPVVLTHSLWVLLSCLPPSCVTDLSW